MAKRANLSDALYCLPVGPLVFGFAREGLRDPCPTLLRCFSPQLQDLGAPPAQLVGPGHAGASGPQAEKARNKAGPGCAAVAFCPDPGQLASAFLAGHASDVICHVFKCTMFLKAFPAQLLFIPLHWNAAWAGKGSSRQLVHVHVA